MNKFNGRSERTHLIKGRQEKHISVHDKDVNYKKVSLYVGVDSPDPCSVTGLKRRSKVENYPTYEDALAVYNKKVARAIKGGWKVLK